MYWPNPLTANGRNSADILYRLRTSPRDEDLAQFITSLLQWLDKIKTETTTCSVVNDWSAVDNNSIEPLCSNSNVQVTKQKYVICSMGLEDA